MTAMQISTRCDHGDPRSVQSSGAQLVAAPNRQDPIEGLLENAFESFERNVERPPDSLAAVACHGGCASCCTIRVAATAPEILLIARTIRSSSNQMEDELRHRVAEADRATKRLDALQRMLAGLACPFIDRDLCVIYSVRPLACRGHASFDEHACVDALAGRPCDVPISALHVTVRSLVQNSMQAALRDAGLAWATYELNQSLQIALSDEACEIGWINGEDVFASAAIAEVSLKEMAETFDAIKAAVL
jgi:Fe-S-cluster containining protein